MDSEITNECQNALDYIFSDETETFRFPSEPDKWQNVTIRLRAKKDTALRAALLTTDFNYAIRLQKSATDSLFDWFETEIVCLDKPVSYYFVLECTFGRVICDKLGARLFAGEEKPTARVPFRFTPGFHVPQWAKGAVEYQIFVDRFYNGNALNDVADNEYYYVIGHSKKKNWNDPVGNKDICTFYGGDLQGVMLKLDYLQEIGVEALYLNPIFISPSSHKYDTQDYEHVDPHFAVISDDLDYEMQGWETHNGYAQRYIRRVTSKENLEKSDAFFARLCEEIHRRGMKIILDGVFNHCGSFSKWMDREGIYLNKPGFEPGAFQSPKSPYREFFNFINSRSGRASDYEGWWEYTTLPKLNYENSEKLCETIYSIAEKWASPPYSIDGWRLDVAADLGHSEEFNHLFWQEFRARLKKINPEILIIAEHYGDASKWLEGNEWDTVMNYDAFMEPVTYFFTGMEKHSDYFRPELYRNGSAFFSSMLEKMAVFEYPSLLSAMNELSNHDHSRFLTRTNMTPGRLESLGSEAAGYGIRPHVFRQAVVVQMTWPGAPTIYYGDEAGQVGWTDPDCRRTYPWDKKNAELVSLHADLSALRKKYSVLKNGSVKPLLADDGIIVYARFDAQRCAVVVCNNTEEEKDLQIPVCLAGAEDGKNFDIVFKTGFSGHSAKPEFCGSVQSGILTVKISGGSSAVLYEGE